MTLSATFEWKRWVAMLCIALFALVVFERACTDQTVKSFGNQAYAMSAMVSDSPNDGVDTSPSAAKIVPHHCCSAHASFVPAAQATPTAPELMARSTPGLLTRDIVVKSTPDGLERPPKALTHA